MCIDLHCHSSASDGSFKPGDLPSLYARQGVSMLALTDHDTVGGRFEFLNACRASGIKGLVGIEFSTVIDKDIEVHVLGYGIPFDDPRWIRFLNEHHEYLRARCERIISILDDYGYKIDIDQVYEISRGNPPMPPHLIAALSNNGVIRDLGEAIRFFLKYLTNDGKAWVPHETPVEKVIEFINEVGAIPIISHPVRMPGIERLEELLDMGAKGFELYYPGQNGPVFETLRDIALKRDCIVTGGCDFHGLFADRRIREIEVPDSVAEHLLNEIDKRAEISEQKRQGAV